MDFGDYANPTRFRRDYPLIIFNMVKYFILILLFLSLVFLLIVICVFLANQETWIETATKQLEQSIFTVNSYSADNVNNQLPSPPPPPPPPSSSSTIIKSQSQETSNVTMVSSGYTVNLINLQLEMFQIKLSLALIYLAVGFISIISDDFNSTLCFSFASLIGFLFSLVKKDNQIHLELMIYTILITFLSFLYCLLLRINVKSKSSYYYGYLQS